jgi:hypothetical protein
MPEVRGRADMLFGATVFEFKLDLRHELGDVQARPPDYLAERERRTGRRYLGIATSPRSSCAGKGAWNLFPWTDPAAGSDRPQAARADSRPKRIGAARGAPW